MNKKLRMTNIKINKKETAKPTPSLIGSNHFTTWFAQTNQNALIPYKSCKRFQKVFVIRITFLASIIQSKNEEWSTSKYFLELLRMIGALSAIIAKRLVQ